jgi:hypothetical protein
MHRRVIGSFALISFAAAGCIVPKDQKPTVALGGEFATKFVHRGMTLVDNPVIQPELGVLLPIENGDTIRVRTMANIDLRNDTGDAWFPDGHAGRATQIEAQVGYAKQFGDVSLFAGVHSYNLPNGTEFVNGERGGTTEVFLVASANVLEATPYFEIHYDYDEVRGAYYRGGISEDIPIGSEKEPDSQRPRWSIALDGSLGYVSEAQSSWMYGFDQAGLADLRGEIVLRYQFDGRTRLSIGAHGSAIWDDDIDDWFRQLGIDDDPIWFTAGVQWIF